ncbi:hypothetical protein BG74_02580 [Sodalis-like endosymbiont of Proechinophthirus fluctus]|nr:hypothetical protein BG74_02580 [Sodalis-like endosymbiont of Proechinophthirus fluctus]
MIREHALSGLEKTVYRIMDLARAKQHGAAAVKKQARRPEKLGKLQTCMWNTNSSQWWRGKGRGRGASFASR